MRACPWRDFSLGVVDGRDLVLAEVIEVLDSDPTAMPAVEPLQAEDQSVGRTGSELTRDPEHVASRLHLDAAALHELHAGRIDDLAEVARTHRALVRQRLPVECAQIGDRSVLCAGVYHRKAPRRPEPSHESVRNRLVARANRHDVVGAGLPIDRRRRRTLEDLGVEVVADLRNPENPHLSTPLHLPLFGAGGVFHPLLDRWLLEVDEHVAPELLAIGARAHGIETVAFDDVDLFTRLLHRFLRELDDLGRPSKSLERARRICDSGVSVRVSLVDAEVLPSRFRDRRPPTENGEEQREGNEKPSHLFVTPLLRRPQRRERQ